MNVSVKYAPQSLKRISVNVANMLNGEASKPTKVIQKVSNFCENPILANLERRANEMSPQDYINARRYLSNLEMIHRRF